MGSVWSLVIIIGPLLLLGAIVFAWYKNRTTSKRVDRRSEQGARELREELAERPQKDIDL